MFIDFMKENYRGLLLNESFWEKYPNKQHVELGKSEYQFLENGKYNEKYFDNVDQQVKEIIQQIFENSDKVTLVINKYIIPYHSKQDKVVKKLIKNPKRCCYEGRHFILKFGEEQMVVNQVVLKTTKEQVKWNYLVQAMLNEDFSDRKPRFKDKYSLCYPDIYLVNEKKD